MRRFILLLTICVLLFCGCTTQQYRTENATFYYPRSEITYGTDEGVIAPEIRTLSGSLAALLSVYLDGPESADLASPCPDGTRLLSTVWNGTLLTLTLSPEFSSLEGIDLTVACTAIAKTCFSLSSATEVCITTQDFVGAPGISVTLTPETIFLFDEITLTDESTTPN